MAARRRSENIFLFYKYVNSKLLITFSTNLNKTTDTVTDKYAPGRPEGAVQPDKLSAMRHSVL